MFFNPGPQELIVVGIVALLLFGKRLPEVARNLGKGFSEFKKGMSGMQDEVRSATNHSSIDYTPSNDSSSANRPEVTDETDAEEEFSAPKFEVED